MSAHEPSHIAAGIPLQTLVAELRGCCEAVSCLQGGSTYFHEELGIFRRVAEDRGLFLKEPPSELSHIPDEEGNEHQVWYRPGSKSVLKATWPDFFGLLVVHRLGEEHMASPVSYLERWVLHNELFGDDVRFLGALATDSGLRLLIEQPAIAGTPATDAEIQRFLTESGWRRFVIEGNVAYFDPERHIAISDTHRGNIILMKDGLLAPIDLRVQLLSDALSDIVVKLCALPHPHSSIDR